eukprot:1633619-Prymnesium_polylepis.1
MQGFSTFTLVKACVRGFRNDPYETFSDAIVLATAFLREARAVHNDRLRADVLIQQACRVQHVMCGILHSLSYTAMGATGHSCLYEFLTSERAMRTIRLAVFAELQGVPHAAGSAGAHEVAVAWQPQGIGATNIVEEGGMLTATGSPNRGTQRASLSRCRWIMHAAFDSTNMTPL